MRQARKVREFDEAFGTALGTRIMAGEIKTTAHALRIAACVIAKWQAEGSPENYDATWANKVK